MQYVQEYRTSAVIQPWLTALNQITTRPWTLMEICGGQTHALLKYGLDQLLPPQITLLHGPGCPVCVTPVEVIDQAIALTAESEVILCSFGDMLRVPGSEADLLSARAKGGKVEILYSPLDALQFARSHPDKQIVFLAVGFETTAPATALAVYQAYEQKISNFSVLLSHVRVPPAMRVILSDPATSIQGFLAAGHVCTVMGIQEYEPIAETFRVPIVVTGFEPLDLVQGIYLCVRQLEEGRHVVENQYRRSVPSQGNPVAQQLLQQVFQVVPQTWRGMGEIPDSGLELRDPYRTLDARQRFTLPVKQQHPEESYCGQILQGIHTPPECPAFGTRCTPERPLGAPMVSSEGVCAAYYRYRQHPMTPV